MKRDLLKNLIIVIWLLIIIFFGTINFWNNRIDFIGITRFGKINLTRFSVSLKLNWQTLGFDKKTWGNKDFRVSENVCYLVTKQPLINGLWIVKVVFDKDFSGAINFRITDYRNREILQKDAIISKGEPFSESFESPLEPGLKLIVRQSGNKGMPCPESIELENLKKYWGKLIFDLPKIFIQNEQQQ